MSSQADRGDSQELISRARGGDGAARGELLLRLQPRLLTRIRLMMGPDARRIAESVDVLNGVLVKAIERMDGAAPADEGQLLRWMTAVARNGIRDDVRRRREQALESLSRSWDAPPLRDARPHTPPSEADLLDDTARLVECLERLGDDERTAIELRNLEELSFAEIGRRLGWSDDKARLTHLRAMARVGQLMGRGREA